VRLEGLGKKKYKFIHLIGIRSREFPDYSTVPQPFRYAVHNKTRDSGLFSRILSRTE
jgi:hypothetical protein